MNNTSIWEFQKSEWLSKDPEGLEKFLWDRRKECLESYPEEEEVRYCSTCGEPLKYGSMSYYEGWHFDSCL